MSRVLSCTRKKRPPVGVVKLVVNSIATPPDRSPFGASNIGFKHVQSYVHNRLHRSRTPSRATVQRVTLAVLRSRADRGRRKHSEARRRGETSTRSTLRPLETSPSDESRGSHEQRESRLREPCTFRKHSASYRLCPMGALTEPVARRERTSHCERDADTVDRAANDHRLSSALSIDHRRSKSTEYLTRWTATCDGAE